MRHQLEMLYGIVFVSLVLVGCGGGFGGVIELRNSSSKHVRAEVSGFPVNPPARHLPPGDVARSQFNPMELPKEVVITWSYVTGFDETHVTTVSLNNLPRQPRKGTIRFEFTDQHEWTVGYTTHQMKL